MYIKAWRNKKISLTAQDSVVVEGGDAPCFAVCALVCDFSRRAECVPTFARESKRRPFVREVENRDERWSEIELLLMVRVLREPGNVCI